MIISSANNFAIKSLNNNATYHFKSDKGAQFHFMELNTLSHSSNCVDISSCSDFTLPIFPTGNLSYQKKEIESILLKALLIKLFLTTLKI